MNLKPALLSFSRYLARIAIQQGVRRALPTIYRRIDEALPAAMLSKASPAFVENLIIEAITKATGLKPTAADVSGVAALYDPIAAAIPLARRFLR